MIGGLSMEDHDGGRYPPPKRNQLQLWRWSICRLTIHQRLLIGLTRTTQHPVQLSCIDTRNRGRESEWGIKTRHQRFKAHPKQRVKLEETTSTLVGIYFGCRVQSPKNNGHLDFDIEWKFEFQIQIYWVCSTKDRSSLFNLYSDINRLQSSMKGKVIWLSQNLNTLRYFRLPDSRVLSSASPLGQV